MQEPPSDSPVDDSGHHCDRVTPGKQADDDKPSLATLRGALTDLPDATYEDFQDIKKGLGASGAGRRVVGAPTQPCPTGLRPCRPLRPG